MTASAFTVALVGSFALPAVVMSPIMSDMAHATPHHASATPQQIRTAESDPLAIPLAPIEVVQVGDTGDHITDESGNTLRVAPFTGQWQMPLPAGSYRTSCPMYCYAGHVGHDLAGRVGTPIYATGSGVVTVSGWYGTAGNAVSIHHGNETETRYYHLNVDPLVEVGDQVEAGQLIGYLGNTGASTGPHLHLEVRVSNIPVNPVDFLASRGVTL